MKRGALFSAIGAVVLCVLVAGPARANPEDVANAIAAEIMSPFCPGVTLENCPSDRAIELRARIESWAQAGWDEERILAELEDLYGRSIRAAPPTSGSGLWAWLAPGLALVGGVAIAGALARRWTSRSDGEARPAPVAAETRARLDEELDALRGRP